MSDNVARAEGNRGPPLTSHFDPTRTFCATQRRPISSPRGRYFTRILVFGYGPGPSKDSRESGCLRPVSPGLRPLFAIQPGRLRRRRKIFRQSHPTRQSILQRVCALGIMPLLRAVLESEQDLGKTIAEVKQNARRAVELDRNNSLAYVVLAWHSIYTKQHDQALVDSNLAVELNPSSALAYNARAFACAFGGRHPEAIADAERSIRYSPRDPFLIMS